MGGTPIRRDRACRRIRCRRNAALAGDVSITSSRAWIHSAVSSGSMSGSWSLNASNSRTATSGAPPRLRRLAGTWPEPVGNACQPVRGGVDRFLLREEVERRVATDEDPWGLRALDGPRSAGLSWGHGGRWDGGWKLGIDRLRRPAAGMFVRSDGPPPRR